LPQKSARIPQKSATVPPRLNIRNRQQNSSAFKMQNSTVMKCWKSEHAVSASGRT
jgi:hypothetical protein